MKQVSKHSLGLNGSIETHWKSIGGGQNSEIPPICIIIVKSVHFDQLGGKK